MFQYQYEAFEARSLFQLRRPYGILCKKNRGGVWMVASVIAPFSDDEAAVSRLAESSTVLGLSPDQLLDIVSYFTARMDPL